MRPSFAIAFQSYRGGVGKTTMVANLGVLLAGQLGEESEVQGGSAKRRHRVLIMDLETDAPGMDECLRHPSDATKCRGLLGLIGDYPKSLDPHSPDGIFRRPERFVYPAPHSPQLDVLPVGFLIGDERQRAREKLYKLLRSEHAREDHIGRIRESVPFVSQLRDFLNARYELVLIDSKSGMSATNFCLVLGLADFLVTLLRPFSDEFYPLRPMVMRFVAERLGAIHQRPSPYPDSLPCLIAVSPRPSSTSPRMVGFFDRLAESFPFAPEGGKGSAMHYSEFPYDAFLQGGGDRILFEADGTAVDPMSPLGCAYEELADLLGSERQRIQPGPKKKPTERPKQQPSRRK